MSMMSACDSPMISTCDSPAMSLSCVGEDQSINSSVTSNLYKSNSGKNLLNYRVTFYKYKFCYFNKI